MIVGTDGQVWTFGSNRWMQVHWSRAALNSKLRSSPCIPPTHVHMRMSRLRASYQPLIVRSCAALLQLGSASWEKGASHHAEPLRVAAFDKLGLKAQAAACGAGAFPGPSGRGCGDGGAGLASLSVTGEVRDTQILQKKGNYSHYSGGINYSQCFGGIHLIPSVTARWVRETGGGEGARLLQVLARILHKQLH